MKNIRPHHLIISTLALGGLGIFFAAFNFARQPLFSSLDQFILVAEDKIHLAQNVQVSSGDLASNKNLLISEINIINGNLFADEIRIVENTQINGNASFNKLKFAKNSQILGTTSTPISLPVIKLPNIPDFQTGNQNLTIKENQTINPGNFNKVEVKENIALTLNPGTYNLNRNVINQIKASNNIPIEEVLPNALAF